MMKIAIYESDEEDAKCLKTMILAYMNAQKTRFEIDMDYRENNIIADISKYDIVILGDKLERKTSLEIGRVLHDLSPKVLLIYYSNKLDTAADSYESYGNGFIKKPIDKKRLFICFDRLCKIQRQNIIEFKDIYGMSIKININDINSIVSKGRYTLVCKNKKVWECNRSLKKWCTLLPNSNFILCKRGVLINLHSIDYINTDRVVVLRNGYRYKLTDKFRRKFQDEYNMYWC